MVSLIWMTLLGSCVGNVVEELPAETPAPKAYVCRKAAAPIKIDGKLDDEAWATAAWTDDFIDIEGSARPKPRFRTRVKMLWDRDYFYIGALLDEPHVWGTLTKHDSVIFHDNDFEVFIDPDGDNHEYYEIEINALNTEWDLFLKKPYRDGGPADDGWEIPGLKTATHVEGTINNPTDRDIGWSVELAIPWNVMKEHANRDAPPRDGDRWRVNFSRVEWETLVEGKAYRKVPGRKEDNWVWSPQGVIDMHRPERWGFVEFREDPKDDRPFRPDSSLSDRDFMMRVYHAQKAYHKTHSRNAETLEALGIRDATKPVTIRLTPEGFEAWVEIPGSAGWPARTVKIRHDSRLTVEPAGS